MEAMMRVSLAICGVAFALTLNGCHTQSVNMTDFWRAQCAELGMEPGSKNMTACVSHMRDEARADMLSAVANY